MEFKFFYNSLFVMKSLTKFINYSIIQNSKRLQTFPKSQENEMYNASNLDLPSILISSRKLLSYN